MRRVTTETGRRTADERREEILDAAFAAFARTGFVGTSTEAIADAVGISQPYLFRLFGTKKLLFLAAVERCLAQTHEVLEAGLATRQPDADPMDAMGEAYRAAIERPGLLRMQMQAYVACDDPDVRAVVREGYGRLVMRIAESTGASPHDVAGFVASGMLLNVLAAMDVLESDLPWAALLREGCIGRP